MNGRVLFYVQHLLGVGHVKRSATIARHLSEIGHDVIVAQGGEPVTLAHFGNARVVQLPSARSEDVSFSVLVDGNGRPIDSAWQDSRRAKLLALFEETQPDVLLIEHFPFGRRKFRFELIPLFEATAKRSAIACSVRDVLVTKSDPKRLTWMVDVARRWFDLILVHGDERLIPFDATFPLAGELSDLIQYTGYVTDGGSTEGGPRPNDHNGGDIVVSIGGGAVGTELLQTALSAARLGQLRNVRWHLLAGRHLDADVFDNLSRNAPENVIIEWARPDFRTLLARASVSVSQAGYNTLMDILSVGCRSIVVPFAAGVESEQLFRARKLEALGILDVLEEHELNDRRLAKMIEVAVQKPKPDSSVTLDLNGAERTAELVTKLVAKRKKG